MSNKQRGFMWPPLLFLGLLLFASYLFKTTLITKSAVDPGEQYTISEEENFDQKSSFQIGTFNLESNSPTTAPPITSAPAPTSPSTPTATPTPSGPTPTTPPAPTATPTPEFR